MYAPWFNILFEYFILNSALEPVITFHRRLYKGLNNGACHPWVAYSECLEEVSNNFLLNLLTPTKSFRFRHAPTVRTPRQWERKISFRRFFILCVCVCALSFWKFRTFVASVAYIFRKRIRLKNFHPRREKFVLPFNFLISNHVF